MTETRGVAAPERGRPGREEARPKLLARLSLFYRQVVAELRKVIWPTRKELITYTSVVVVFVLAMIALVSTVDLGFGKLVFWIFG